MINPIAAEVKKFNNIPEEMKSIKQWVNWKFELRDGDKKTKVPYNPNSPTRKAATNNPKTWGTFEQVTKLFIDNKHDFDGIGFVFTDEAGFVGIDIDHCVDQTGKINPEAIECIQNLNSYTEYSPSQTGVHIITKGEIPKNYKNTKAGVEFYSNKRFFCMTGNRLKNYSDLITENTEQLKKEYDNFSLEAKKKEDNISLLPQTCSILSDEEILARAKKAKNGYLFQQLFDFGNWRKLPYPSQSEADLALCCLLAYWFNNDFDKIHKMFRQSKLYRSKWDREDYSKPTIEKAIKLVKKNDRSKIARDLDTTCENSFIPQLYTDEEILKMEFQEMVWAIPDMIPEGLTILAGKPKTGKSWFALSLAKALGVGDMALGKIQVQKCKVLYLALEDTKRRMKSRMEQLNIQPNGGIQVAFDWPKGQQGIKEIDDFLSENNETKFVIIDTLQKICELSRKNVNAYEADYEKMSEIKKIADNHSVALLVIHHLRKGISTDPLEMISGSNGLPAVADTIAVLQHGRGEIDATLFLTGRDIEEQSLALKKHEMEWILCSDADKYNRSSQRRKIIDFLKQTKEAKSTREIALAIGAKQENVKALVHKMYNQRILRKAERGKYTVNVNFIGSSNFASSNEIIY